MGRFVSIQKENQVIAERIAVAERTFERMRGLLGVSHMKQGEGLFFPNCSSVHMWGMKISLDIVFLKKLPNDRRDFQVTRVSKSVKPWTFWPLVSWDATEVLELASGTVDGWRDQFGWELQRGDVLCLN